MAKYPAIIPKIGKPNHRIFAKLGLFETTARSPPNASQMIIFTITQPGKEEWDISICFSIEKPARMSKIRPNPCVIAASNRYLFEDFVPPFIVKRAIPPKERKSKKIPVTWMSLSS